MDGRTRRLWTWSAGSILVLAAVLAAWCPHRGLNLRWTPSAVEDRLHGRIRLGTPWIEVMATLHHEGPNLPVEYGDRTFDASAASFYILTPGRVKELGGLSGGYYGRAVWSVAVGPRGGRGQQSMRVRRVMAGVRGITGIITMSFYFDGRDRLVYYTIEPYYNV